MKKVIIIIFYVSALLILTNNVNADINIIDSATYNGHTYYLLSQSNWADAENYAQTIGGHLATVESGDENTFLYDSFGSLVLQNSSLDKVSLWIGLNDVANEGTFVWSSGSSATYRNWLTGQPESTWDDEDYVGILVQNYGISSMWHDIVYDTRLNDVTFGVAEVVPLPGAVLLGSLGLSLSGWMLKRRRAI